MKIWSSLFAKTGQREESVVVTERDVFVLRERVLAKWNF